MDHEELLDSKVGGTGAVKLPPQEEMEMDHEAYTKLVAHDKDKIEMLRDAWQWQCSLCRTLVQDGVEVAWVELGRISMVLKAFSLEQKTLQQRQYEWLDRCWQERLSSRRERSNHD